jgi:RimJ/RimL family protein N-acetyltransferase
MCAVEILPAVGTERLILRGPVKGDAPAIAEFANDVRVAGMTSSMPYPYAVADAEAHLDATARSDRRAHAEFVIEHREFGVIGVIGMVGFKAREPRRPEIGYWLGQPFWGRGYATEAVTAALGWARRDWRRNVVWAGHFADNPASGQVLCKAGFLYTGDVELRAAPARGGAMQRTRMMVWLA